MASFKLFMTATWLRHSTSRVTDSQLLFRVVSNGINKVSVAGVCHKDRLDPVVRSLKPKPWPYEKKPSPMLRLALGIESTIDRFDENTVLISIEGLPATGKTALANKLAEMTDMMKKHEDLNMDFIYVRPDGIDYRDLNKFYYPEAQYADVKTFLQNPNHPKIAYMQVEMYKLRYLQYIESMVHLLNTGQGVVMERNPWSDIAFMEAMYKCGYVNADQWQFYRRVRHNTEYELWRPHLIIYIDTPIDKVLHNVKKRNIPHEVNSKIWNTKFLEALEESYKKSILPELEHHSHTLVYEYRDEFDVDAILQDIEKLNFQVYTTHTRLKDWDCQSDTEWADARHNFHNNVQVLMGKFNLPCWDVEGYDYSNEAEALQFQTERALLQTYYPGFDLKKQSYWNLMFKGEPTSEWDERALNVFKAYEN